VLPGAERTLTEITDLPTGPPGDLDRQSRLTDRLLRARPGLTHTPGPDPAAWTEAVAATLRTPVLLESHGPRTTDKRMPRPATTRAPLA